MELQISSSKGSPSVVKTPVLPQKEELERFAHEARKALHNLSFSQKRAHTIEHRRQNRWYAKPIANIRLYSNKKSCRVQN